MLGRALGQGGFGITYLAWDLRLGRKRAIKEYFPRGVARRADDAPDVAVDSTEQGQFRTGLQGYLDEARLLAQFERHASIVSPHTFFRANGTAYLVMEYLEGETLASYVQRQGGRIPYAHALHFIYPVIEALEAIHAANITHRDVTPDNVFLTVEGDTKLIDFGAARQQLAQARGGTDVILRECYAPPEQYAQSGRQGPWTDVYALCATFYYAITGQPPPPAMDRYENDEWQRPSELGVEIPSEAQEALQRGLALRTWERLELPELAAALRSEGPLAPAADGLDAAADRALSAFEIDELVPVEESFIEERKELEPGTLRIDPGLLAPDFDLEAGPEVDPRPEPGAEPGVDPGTASEADPEAEPPQLVAVLEPDSLEPAALASGSSAADAASASRKVRLEDVRVPELGSEGSPHTASDPERRARTHDRLRATLAFGISALVSALVLRAVWLDARGSGLTSPAESLAAVSTGPATPPSERPREASPGANSVSSMAPDATSLAAFGGRGVAGGLGRMLREAQAGDLGAMLSLGRAYASGAGTSIDDAQALRWVREAALGGNTDAQFTLGLRYETGRWVDAEQVPVLRRTRRELGGEDLEINSLLHPLAKRTPAQNLPEAATWYEQAAEAGHAPARLRLGYLFWLGEGVARDRQQAFKWFNLAAESGLADAQLLAGLCYSEGAGVRRDPSTGLGWLERAASQGSALAKELASEHEPAAP